MAEQKRTEKQIAVDAAHQIWKMYLNGACTLWRDKSEEIILKAIQEAERAR